MIHSKEKFYTFEYTEAPGDPVLIYLNSETPKDLHTQSPHLLANDVASFTFFYKSMGSTPGCILYPPFFEMMEEVFDWETFQNTLKKSY